MEKVILISSNEQYHQLLNIVYEMMNKGEVNLTDDEIDWISTTTPIIERYEDEVNLKDKTA